MTRAARFWNRMAARYARQPVADEAAYRKKLAITRAYLRPDMALLELGCGTGSTAIAHAPHVKHIRAVDFSQKMVAIARAKAAAAGVTNVDFETAAIDDLDIADASLDMVLALSLLHLVDDRDRVIARVHRALKPGGVLVTSTTCLADSMNWFRYVAPLGRAVGLVPPVRFFTAAELRDSFVRAGFAIEHDWQPGKARAVFIVARKPIERSAA